MASTETLDGDQRQRLANQYETFVLSMATLRGEPLSADQTSQIVNRAIASASPEERRNPVPSLDAINRLQQFLVQVTEVGRPRNDFSAEAARAAQAANGMGGSRGAGFSAIDALRAASSARFRELSGDGGTKGSSGQNGSSQTGTGGAVTAEFLRSFAGMGLASGTVRTFAEVGLDRSTYNDFRREGFSQAQITDNARDVKALGWKGKDDLSIAQHASTDVRKAAVATEQAKTTEERARRQAHEDALEQKNEARPDTDPQKQHNRRFFERRHQDHLRHDARAGLGKEAQKHDAALPAPQARPDTAGRRSQDGLMAKYEKQKTAALSYGADDAFGSSAPPTSTPTPTKSAPVRTAATKPATLTVG